MNKIASSDVLFMKIAHSISIDEADTFKGCMSGKGGNVSQDDLLKVAGLIGYMQKTAKVKGSGGGLPSAGIDAVTNYLKNLKPGKARNNVSIPEALRLFGSAYDSGSMHADAYKRNWLRNGLDLSHPFANSADWMNQYDELLKAKGTGSIERFLYKLWHLGGHGPFALTNDAIKAQRMALQMASKGLDPASQAGTDFINLYKNITNNLSKGMSVNQSDLNTYNATAQGLGLPQLGGVNGALTPNEVNTYLKSVGETKSYANRMDKQNRKLTNDMNNQRLKNQKLKSDIDALKKEKKLKEQAERDKYWWQNPWAAGTLGIGAGAAGLYGLDAIRDVKKNERDRRGGAIVF